MAERARVQAAPYLIPNGIARHFSDDVELDSYERRERRKYVDRKRRDNTRRCVDELGVIVGEAGLAEDQNASTILSAAVAYVQQLAAEASASRPVKAESPQEGTWVSLLGESVGQLKIVMDLNGDIVHAADSTRHLLGYPPQSLQRTPLRDIVHPLDHHFLTSRLMPERPTSLSARLLTANGAVKNFSLSVRTVTDTSTNTKYVVLTGQDQPLRFGLEQWMLPYSSSLPELFVSHHSPAGTILRVTPNVERILGYPTAEVLGKSPYVLHHVDDVPRLADTHAALMRSSSATAVYRTFNKHVNKHIWVQTEFSVVNDDATGRPCALVCKTKLCDPMSVSVLAPASDPAEQSQMASGESDVLRKLLDSLSQENAVLWDVLDHHKRQWPPTTGSHRPPQSTPIVSPPSSGYYRDHGYQQNGTAPYRIPS